MDLIYVVVPVYQVEPYIHRCIDSILNQTYGNIKLILVDDGSPDNCPAICDEYMKQDPRIHIIHQENGGLSAARNTGIEYALRSGDPTKNWITFIDSDDYVHPKYLEYLHRAAAESGTAVSSCTYKRTELTHANHPEIGKLIYQCVKPEEYWCSNHSVACHAWGKLYRTSLFARISYPIGKYYEDEYTTYKLLFQQAQIAAMQAPLYYWYDNPHSITAPTWAPNRIDQLNALEEQLPFFRQNGYANAYKASVRMLYLQSVLQLKFVHGASPRYDVFIKEMQRRRSRAFHIFAEEFGMWEGILLWFEIVVIRSVKRLFRSKSIFSTLCRKFKKAFHL